MSKELDLSGFDEAVASAPTQNKELDLSGFDAAQISQLESGTRGAIQGATMGFGDELAGTGGSVIQSFLESIGARKDNNKDFGQQYGEIRDEERAANLAAQEANPWTYNGADMATSVATGLIGGGLGVAGKGLAKLGAKKLVEDGVKRGSLRGLSVLGMTEGAAHGLGRSEADNIKDATIDTATGAAIGLAAPVLIKGTGAAIKGAAKGTDKLISKTWVLGDIYDELKEVGSEALKNTGKTFKQAATHARDQLGLTADDIKSKGVAQKSKFEDDLLNLQKRAASNLDSSGTKLREDLYTTMNNVGQDLHAKDLQINDMINSFGGLNNEIRQTPNGITIGKFNFDDVLAKIDGISEQLEKPRAGLKDIKAKIQSGDYLTVADKIRDLNDMIAQASPYDRKYLGALKKEIQDVVDNNLKNLPGDAGALYEQRMGIAKKYSLLADVRENLSLRPMEDNALIADSAKLMANETETAGMPLKRTLDNVKVVGDQQVNVSADNLMASGKEFNRAKINPELGKMDLGENEALLKQFTEVFGAPEEFGIGSSFAKTIENADNLSKGLKSEKNQSKLLDYIHKTYGDKADGIIKELRERSKSFNTLKSALDEKVASGQDLTSFIRAGKRIAKEAVFDSTQFGNNVLNKIPTPKIVNASRSITQPAQTYKDAVQNFKQSQTNGGADPEAE